MEVEKAGQHKSPTKVTPIMSHALQLCSQMTHTLTALFTPDQTIPGLEHTYPIRHLPIMNSKAILQMLLHYLFPKIKLYCQARGILPQEFG